MQPFLIDSIIFYLRVNKERYFEKPELYIFGYPEHEMLFLELSFSSQPNTFFFKRQGLIQIYV